MLHTLYLLFGFTDQWYLTVFVRFRRFPGHGRPGLSNARMALTFLLWHVLCTSQNCISLTNAFSPLQGSSIIDLPHCHMPGQ